MTHVNSLRVFQTQNAIIPILFISLLGSSILVSMPNSSAQEDTQIPGWIKDVAGWWADDQISEKEFLNGIEYLINNNIITLHFVPCHDVQNETGWTSQSVPNWTISSRIVLRPRKRSRVFFQIILFSIKRCGSGIFRFP